MSLKSTLLAFNIFQNRAEMFNISPVYPMLLPQVSDADRAWEDASETFPTYVNYSEEAFLLCVENTNQVCLTLYQRH